MTCHASPQVGTPRHACAAGARYHTFTLTRSDIGTTLRFEAPAVDGTTTIVNAHAETRSEDELATTTTAQGDSPRQ